MAQYNRSRKDLPRSIEFGTGLGAVYWEFFGADSMSVSLAFPIWQGGVLVACQESVNTRNVPLFHFKCLGNILLMGAPIYCHNHTQPKTLFLCPNITTQNVVTRPLNTTLWFVYWGGGWVQRQRYMGSGRTFCVSQLSQLILEIGGWKQVMWRY